MLFLGFGETHIHHHISHVQWSTYLEDYCGTASICQHTIDYS